MRRRIEHELNKYQQQHYLKTTFHNWPEYVLEHLVSRVMKLDPDLYNEWHTDQNNLYWRQQSVDTTSIHGKTRYLAGPTAIVEEQGPNNYQLLAGAPSPNELTSVWILYRIDPIVTPENPTSI